MATKKRTYSRAGKATGPGEPDIAVGIRSLLQKFDEQLNGGELKITVADFIRLVQMKQDLDKAAPQDIEVRWVDNLDEPFDNER